MIENLLNNNLVFICLISGIVCLTTGYFIKTLIYSSPINTPNSPQTFNFTHEDLKKLNGILDEGEVLNEQIRDKLDQDIKTMLGEEDHTKFKSELEVIQADLDKQLQDIFKDMDFSNISHSGIDYTSILEFLDIITNFISHFYL
jgi:hypothetical protein